MKRNRRAAATPRLGPPTNLRPAGAHKSRRMESRQRVKARLNRQDWE